MYDEVTLLYSRDWHDITNQRYFNKKLKLKKKEISAHIVEIVLGVPSRREGG